MSVISEYLKLIPKGLPNSVQIVEAIFTNAQFVLNKLPEDQRNEIIRRRVICAGCPFMSKNAKTSNEYKELTGANYKTDRNDDHCAFCGCGINIRTSSLGSVCGIEKWNQDNPDNQIQLKWEKYEQKN